MKFCASCGAPAQGAFCGNCGASLERVELPTIVPATPDPPSTAVTPLPPPPPAPLAPAPPPPPAPAPPAPTQVAPPSAPLVDPPGTQRRTGLVVVSLLAIAAIAAGIVLLVSRDDGTSASAASTTAVDPNATAATTTTPSTAAPTTAAPAPPPPTATPTTTDPVAAAQAQLTTLLQTDQATADSLQNQYVPQLSAKRVGLQIDGITYGPVEILADHTTRRDAYGAILVDAGRYQFENNGQPMAGWYLTIVPVAFPTRDAATAWCTDRGLGPDQCFGRIFKPLA